MMSKPLFAAFFALFSSLFAYAASQGGAQVLSPGAPNFDQSIRGSVIELTPPAGHHFNEKAPNQLRLDKAPLKAEIRREKITAKIPRPHGTIHATVYLCDDAGTFCAKQVRDIALDDRSAAKEAPTPSHTSLKRKSRIETETGFIVNDPKFAFAEAARLHRPVLIDFFGIWCPPCNHLDAMVFRAEQFKRKASEKLIRLKIDSDSDLAIEWKKKYRILGLPTVVFVTADGEEITRTLGYRPLDEMLRKAEVAWQNRDNGFDTLLRRARLRDAEAQFRASEILLDLEQPKEALAWLAPMKPMFEAALDPRLETVYRAEVAAAIAKEDKTSAKQALRKWTTLFPGTPRAIENLQQLADLEEETADSNAKDEALRGALATAEKLLSQPESLAEHLQGSEYSAADLFETLADLNERTGRQEAARDAYLKAADAYLAEAQAEKSAYARGPNLERAYCLNKAGKHAEAEAIYREGVRRFPAEYTFHKALADLLVSDLKQPEKALVEIDRALEAAYGPQRLKAVGIKAKALEAMGRFESAAHAIEIELNARPADGDIASTMRLRKKLEARRTELLNRI